MSGPPGLASPVTAPAPGSLLRTLVIRGDLTTVGVAAVLAGVVLAGLVAAGAVPPAPGLLLGGVAAASGVALVRWSRVRWRALLQEVTRAHEDLDPGDSPVAWIGDGLWRARNAFDPSLDAEILLLSEVDPLVRGFGQEGQGAFSEPILRPVTPEERALAPATELPEGLALPPKGDADALLAALATTPGRFIAVAPRWPVCCGGLTTLVSVRADTLSPKARYLPVETGQDLDPDDPRGTHGFVCHRCGRHYASDPGW